MYDIRIAVRDLFVAARVLWITSIDKSVSRRGSNTMKERVPCGRAPGGPPPGGAI